jgi:hypothetical protein
VGRSQRRSLEWVRGLAVHFEKVFELLDAILGEGHDGIFADTVT